MVAPLSQLYNSLMSAGGYRGQYKTPEQTAEDLANLLAEPPYDSRHLAAEAEFRLREHESILAQAGSAARQADAAERGADATERGAKATERYVRLTFWLLIFTALTALAAAAGTIRSCQISGETQADSHHRTQAKVAPPVTPARKAATEPNPKP